MSPAQPPYRISDWMTPAWREAELQRIAEWASTLPAMRALGQNFVDELAVSQGSVLPRTLAANILAWVHEHIGYADDPPGEEWYQGPYWTMAMGGDCEDLAVVLVALLLAAGLQARVKWQDQPGQALNHVTVLVMLPEGVPTWVWADPTVRGAQLGEEPHAAAQRLNQLDKLGLPSTQVL